MFHKFEKITQPATTVEPHARTRASAPDGRRDGEVEGAQPSNRAPSNSIPENIIPLLWGIDSLYLSFQGDLYEKREEELEHLKLLAQSESEKEQAQACEFRYKLDTHSTTNWTAIPEQTGHLVHGKLDSKIEM